MLEILLYFGADINIANDNAAPILAAVIAGNVDGVKLLLSHAPDLAMPGANGEVKYFAHNPLVKQEIIRFEQDPIDYVMHNNHNITTTLKALDNLLYVFPLLYEKEIQQLKTCLANLDNTILYDNLECSYCMGGQSLNVEF